MNKPPKIVIRHHRSSHLYGFRYCWLMYTTGFDLSQHCLACLHGHRSQRVHNKIQIGPDHPVVCDESPTPFQAIYLCGVASCRKWEANLHVVFQPSEGDTFKRSTYNGFQVIVENARPIPFPPLPDGWRGLGPKFTTCRNYRFGVYFYGPNGDGGTQKDNFI